MQRWGSHQSSVCPREHAVDRGFHMLWSGKITEVVLLTLASFRATQQGYGAGLTLWLYGPGDQAAAARQLEQDPRWQRLLSSRGASLDLKPLGSRELFAMAVGSPVEDMAFGAWRRFFFQEASVPLQVLSDFLRLFLLERLGGGIYVDADVLFLSSWRPLLCSFGGGFAYEWGPDQYMNTAVLAVPRGSPVAACLLRAAANGPQANIPNPFHPGELSRLAHQHCGDGLAMLPSEMFDPFWTFQYGRDSSNRPPWMGAQADPAQTFKRLCVATEGEATSSDASVSEVLGSGALAFHLHADNCPSVEAGSWLRAAGDHFSSTLSSSPGALSQEKADL